MTQLQEFLTATKAFLALKPSLENIKAFMSLSDMQIRLQFDLSVVNIRKPRNVAVDVSAALFLPDEYKHLICGVTTGDGACLFNAASLFLVANESLSLILRAATVHELLSYPEFYLRLPVFMTDWPWSNAALNANNQNDPDNSQYRKASIYKNEVADFCAPNAYSPLLAVYGLASAISRPINSIYPPNSESPYHQLILPRQVNHFQPPINIMWVNIVITTQAEFTAWINSSLPMAGLAPVKELEVKIEAGKEIRYKSLDDIKIVLERDEAANLVTTDHCWKDSYTSHYWLRQIIRRKGLFPQVAISIDRTRELENSLKKYFHCSGCIDKRTSTAGLFCIAKQELKEKTETIHLHIQSLENRRCCVHHTGICYGQMRGLSAALLREKDALPRQLRAERLEAIPLQQRLTGNRQDVPSPQAARKLKQTGINNKNDYTVGERFHASISIINENEKLKYAEDNSEKAEKDRKLRG
ncbi:4176_t:CDS:2, partial [Paraglomus occultum]